MLFCPGARRRPPTESRSQVAICEPEREENCAYGAAHCSEKATAGGAMNNVVAHADGPGLTGQDDRGVIKAKEAIISDMLRRSRVHRAPDDRRGSAGISSHRVGGPRTAWRQAVNEPARACVREMTVLGLARHSWGAAGQGVGGAPQGAAGAGAILPPPHGRCASGIATGSQRGQERVAVAARVDKHRPAPSAVQPRAGVVERQGEDLVFASAFRGARHLHDDRAMSAARRGRACHAASAGRVAAGSEAAKRNGGSPSWKAAAGLNATLPVPPAAWASLLQGGPGRPEDGGPWNSCVRYPLAPPRGHLLPRVGLTVA